MKIQSVPWTMRDLTLAILVAAAGVLALNGAFLLLDRAFSGTWHDNSEAIAGFIVLQEFVILSATLLFSKMRYQVGWDLLGLREFEIAGGCTLSIALLFGSYVIRMIYVGAAYLFGIRLAPQQVLTRLDTAGVGFVITLLIGGILAPVIEEIFFRGFVYAGLRQRIGIVAAMIVSTLFFTALHLSIELFIPIFVLGLFLAWLYERTGSLYPGIFLHVANNTIALIALAVMQAMGIKLT